jgi:hypothetical protein
VTELTLGDRRLLVDRNDGVLLDLTEDRRSGTMTTGTPPFFHTSRRALRLEMELVVAVEAWLSRTPSSARDAGGFRRRCSSMAGETDVRAELAGEISEPESRKALCFLTCRSVLRR